ncbi:MAG TPA: hypothetical protein VNT77_10665 [Allosphingosinicella sp.]|nr:hypothetical protein [Allosphingosinicella sp.]
MAVEDPETPPLVVKERRRGTALTIAALTLLVLVALFLLFGDRILPADPAVETDVKVEVDPAKGVEKSE